LYIVFESQASKLNISFVIFSFTSFVVIFFFLWLLQTVNAQHILNLYNCYLSWFWLLLSR